MLARDSCVFLPGLHRKHDSEERALVVVGYADPPGVEPQNQCLKNPTTTTLAPWRVFYIITEIISRVKLFILNKS